MTSLSRAGPLQGWPLEFLTNGCAGLRGWFHVNAILGCGYLGMLLPSAICKSRIRHNNSIAESPQWNDQRSPLSISLINVHFLTILAGS